MHEAEKLSLEQIEAFLNASEEIRFEGETRKQIIAAARERAVEMTEENNPPTPRAGDYSLPWKAQTTKARFPHSHRPGC